MHLNPFQLWKDQSPRQIFELLKSYREMHEELQKEDGAGNATNSAGKKNYTVKSKGVRIPSWYTVPEGAVVYDADHVFQGDI
jgi:hypothetical protein